MRLTEPIGNPDSSKAGFKACSTIAFAVNKASEPILKTTVLPDRRTPVASAKTLGLPSKIKPTAPSPAVINLTFHPS